MPSPPPLSPGAGDLRRVIQWALTAAQAGAPEQDRPPYRALELADIERSDSATRAATSLKVSRATSYRWLQRGLAGLVAALNAAPPAR